MKISPVASSANTVGAVSGSDPQAARIQTARSIRMSTNATPGRAEPPPPVDTSLTIPDTIDPANAAPEATQPLSPQAAALAKQRRALQVKERELADREKALSAAAPAQGASVDLARLKSEPLSVLLEAGVTYDQLTEAILANKDGNAPDIQALIDKKFAERDTLSEKQVLAEMQRDATRMAAEGDAFELVRETGSVPDVMRLIEMTYRKTGEVMDVKEAMQLVEDELIAEGLKMVNLKKVQGRLAPQAQPPQQQRQPQMRTLTNRDTAQVPMSRKAKALAAFAGTLK